MTPGTTVRLRTKPQGITERQAVEQAIESLVRVRAIVPLAPHTRHQVDHVVRQLLFRLDTIVGGELCE